MRQVRNVEVSTLVCSRPPRCRSNGWSFPKTIEDLLRSELAGKSVLHLFGGLARFGVRMDIDPTTRPDVIGDAWLPPFARSSFDVAVLDPPYVRFSAQMTMALCCQAAHVAREQVIWFSTFWLDHPARLRLRKAYAVVVGRNATMRCLQFFDVPENKMEPMRKFSRGPAIKYNRWLQNPRILPFGESAPGPAILEDPATLEDIA
jgi:hypothetical protein